MPMAFHLVCYYLLLVTGVTVLEWSPMQSANAFTRAFPFEFRLDSPSPE